MWNITEGNVLQITPYPPVEHTNVEKRIICGVFTRRQSGQCVSSSIYCKSFIPFFPTTLCVLIHCHDGSEAMSEGVKKLFTHNASVFLPISLANRQISETVSSNSVTSLTLHRSYLWQSMPCPSISACRRQTSTSKHCRTPLIHCQCSSLATPRELPYGATSQTTSNSTGRVSS